MENFQTLVPFPGEPGSELAQARYRIRAAAQAGESEWTIRFEVSARTEGALSSLSLPSVARTGERRDGLWKTTCFEVFVANPQSTEYWEWNGSANGDWNLYHFDDYRVGMKTVASRDELPQFREIQRTEERWLGEWKIPRALLPIVGPVALTAVTDSIVAGRGSLAYWALAHSSSQPDFHRRASFIYSPT